MDTTIGNTKEPKKNVLNFPRRLDLKSSNKKSTCNKFINLLHMEKYQEK